MNLDQITLSTGKVLTFKKMDNGATDCLVVMTEAEWEEYCIMVRETQKGNVCFG